MAFSLGNLSPKPLKPFGSAKTVSRGMKPAKSAKGNKLGKRDSRGLKKSS